MVRSRAWRGVSIPIDADPVAGDHVQLSNRSAYVARDDAVAESPEVILSERLAAKPER